MVVGLRRSCEQSQPFRNASVCEAELLLSFTIYYNFFSFFNRVCELGQRFFFVSIKLLKVFLRL